MSVLDADMAELLSNVQEYFVNGYDEADDFVSAEQEQRARTQTVLGESCDLRYSFAKGDPPCSACGAVLTVGEAAGDPNSELRCSCGCQHPLVSAREGVVNALECDVQVLTTASDDVREPVSASCPQCGAELSIAHDSRRVCQCQYCEVQIFLPTQIWEALHPVPRVEPWYVRFLE